MMTTPFTHEMEVRDYECDIEGVVNNAVYQNYLEHARHVFLKAAGVDFAGLVETGVHLVVTRVEMDFLDSLRPGDRFHISVAAERVSRLRFGFRQEIRRMPDDKVMLRAFVIGTALNLRGRPHLPSVIEALLTAHPDGHLA